MARATRNKKRKNDPRQPFCRRSSTRKMGIPSGPVCPGAGTSLGPPLVHGPSNICFPPARSYPMVFPTSGNWFERDISIALSSRDEARTASKTPFLWVNTLLGNVRNVLYGTYHAVREKHLLSDLGKFCYRFNRRFQFQDLLPRFLYVALRTPPLPYRLAKMAEGHG